jgi:transposase
MDSIKHRRRGRQEKEKPDLERGVVVALDISKDAIHYGMFRREGGRPIRRMSQDLAGFQQLEADLQRLQQLGLQVWVGYEPTGCYSQCILEWLSERGRRVVGVNPFHVHRTKELSDNSPTKSDRKDPRVIAELVWAGHWFQPKRLQGEYAQLRVASREWESLRTSSTRVRNEFQAELRVWFPELGAAFRSPLAKSVRGIVRAYQSVREVAAGRRPGRRLRKVLQKATHGRCGHRAGALLEAARASVAPSLGQGARQRRLVRLLEQLELVERQQAQLKAEMEAHLAQLPEAQWLRSVPQVGTITVAGLLGECGSLADFDCRVEAVEKFVGLNLCSQSSGKYEGEAHISKRGRAAARYLLCQAGIRQAKRGGLYQAEAEALRARLDQRSKEAKKRTGQIRVALARKLLTLLCALVREGRCYQERSATGAGAEGGLVIHRGAPQKAA